jgi:hypothetical protein
MHTHFAFDELSEWHQEMLSRLLNASFPGQQDLKLQVLESRFRVIDKNQSLEILPTSSAATRVVRTVPVEARTLDVDGVPIESLLFTRHGFAYMLEIMRADGEPVKRLPPATAFDIIALGS